MKFGRVLAGAAGIAYAANWGRNRLKLSRAKHRGLIGHVRMAKRVAGLLPFYEFDREAFFRADGAPDDVAARREAGFTQLSSIYQARFAKSAAASAEMKDSIPDIAFTSTYRVPFQFSRVVRENLPSGSFYEASEGVMLTDLDGNEFYDLTGSYGVNLLGVDAYRGMIERGAKTVSDLGPVLGGLHPVVSDNVKRLKAISGLDAVSFHMSGTEAVMQAVRLARYHTGKDRLVRFAGAYHGWWGDVQPGIGNPVPADRTYTLADMSEATLEVLRTRKNIACVLVNPLQAMHPNSNAPGDSALVDSSRRAHVDRAAYSGWLAKLREVCTEAGIVLIVDEVFTGFRLAARGACEYFGIEPDMVTYGKTLGGGLPVGVLCGRADLMKRYKDDKPADICFARGTFNSHPYVMGAMDQFLQWHAGDEARKAYEGLDECWNRRAEALNERLEAEDLSPRVANLSAVWTCYYTRPSRYNWMLQYYLRAEGLALGWTGTGRFIFSLAFGDQEFAEVADRFVEAARKFENDGWAWGPEGASDKDLKRQILKESLRTKFGRG
ncbi:aminotransferase class III-fold pyridoxal phosphate-dependent enzyme [Aurantiacibacter poecillastricola]|uniref:aminotransferase class III-fold pyridoxal phosphate-dependent enzyme n=1 Tax=Aurantiacibacter poecillastricola TaxID=3064385 RepID=UPI00273F8FE9|nr:aminotransferase class III-fold pyridoxal phosphate-dependent enzyme [Aurantiacibacter sp. 219JJ12-13]MDP5262815.1 aminotransferase class III-fold pyridoxal phosphate-dependent enzyme [Aurantiacibacter sp. 219JJ12-13]